MVTKNTKTTNDNKSPGLEGIPQILLLATVDKISIPVAKVSMFPLEEERVQEISKEIILQ